MFLGDMGPKDISDFVETCEDQKLNEHERAEAEVRCVYSGCTAEAWKRFGTDWYCEEHYDYTTDGFRDMAKSAAMDIGLTEDEAEREVEEYMG